MSDAVPTSEIRATYRVQLNSAFTFDDVARIAPYLAALGVSHVYCSPYLQAYPGSTHGYDVIDHSQLNAELGGRAGFDRMVDTLEENGLGHIIDIVPNHVSIEGVLNRMWWDVLKLGRASAYEPYFDIDWDTDIDDLTGKVLVPILGTSLDEAVERGEVTIERPGEEPVVRYFDHRLPLAPGTHEGTAADVLARQNYLLAHWKRAARHLNYRRFFDIDTLAGLQVGAPGVFEETHGLILDLLRGGSIQGLRVDHIDGLRDPLGYLRRLRDEGAPYVVVEKILEPGEDLPGSWPVDGTTGYDFLNVVAGLFVDPTGEDALTHIYADYTSEPADVEVVKREKKMLIMRQVMVSDVNRLVREFMRAFPERGFDEDEIRVAVAETIATFEVYRTYLGPDGSMTDEDRRVIDEAISAARSRADYLDASIFDALRAALLMEVDPAREFALRFQQTTGSIMAKGVEDTVFYNYNRLVSLNEVGGDPGRFGVGVDEFHRWAERTSRARPRTMLATSTHDTKRSEDVRARINLLSEIPERWGEAVERWSEVAATHRTGSLPDPNAAYLFFQTLVGAYPLPAERAVEYMRKASKEAKRYTSWIDPRPDYDETLERFVRGVLGDTGFMAEVAAFVKPLIEPGRITSLAQTLVRLTHPGIPDTYQGTELWDDSLVDPDNRRPVDYTRMAALLRRTETVDAADLWAQPDDGAPKMLVVARTLDVRGKRPAALGPTGAYARLPVTGAHAGNALCYLRGDDVAVIVPRLVMGLADGWGDTAVELPTGNWMDALTGRETEGGRADLARLTAAFPVALLTRR